MFGRQKKPSESHIEVSVPPALYDSLQQQGLDHSEYLGSIIGAVLSAALGAGRGHNGHVEVSLSS